MRECHVLPLQVGRLLLPLRELIAALSLSRRLPQIEVAVGQSGGVQRIVLVLRVLQQPDAEDLARLEAFAGAHAVSIWLQPGGPDTAAPMSRSQAVGLTLELPEFGVSLPFAPTDFTQVNHRVNEVLVRAAVRLLDPQPHDRVVDFFCGLGNFTLALARRCAAVVGVEGSRDLLVRASEAAQRHGVGGRIDFLERNLFDWTTSEWEQLLARGPVDRVLIDPPREGALALVRVLADARTPPRRVVYVSCNPATLARDCAVLVHDGGWSLAAAGVVNMFPHTSHVESIAMLEPPHATASSPLPAC
jgi:23S rRNA (uracil1939-C5)-methyltransferase